MQIVSSKWDEQRVRIPGRMTFLPYYTASPWGENEAYFFFFSALPDFSRSWIHTWSPAERRMTAEFELKEWNGLPLRLHSELLISSVFLPERRLVLIPLLEKLCAVSLDDGSVTEVWRGSDAAMRLGGPGALSRDGKLVAYAEYPQDFSVSRQVSLTILDSSDFRPVGTQVFHDFLANHFQFMDDSDWLLYAHEGSTETIPDRVNRINWRTGERQLLHRHETAPDGTLLECIGHEMTRGETVCAVRYPVSVLPGALVTMRTDGSAYTILDCDDYWHSSCNADGTVFAMDTLWWGNARRKTPREIDIIRIDSKAGTKEIVKTVHSDPKEQYRHSHPQLNAAGNKLLFIEDADDSAALGSVTLRTMA